MMPSMFVSALSGDSRRAPGQARQVQLLACILVYVGGTSLWFLDLGTDLWTLLLRRMKNSSRDIQVDSAKALSCGICNRSMMSISSCRSWPVLSRKEMNVHSVLSCSSNDKATFVVGSLRHSAPVLGLLHKGHANVLNRWVQLQEELSILQTGSRHGECKRSGNGRSAFLGHRSD